jgi:hypothetical protein
VSEQYYQMLAAVSLPRQLFRHGQLLPPSVHCIPDDVLTNERPFLANFVVSGVADHWGGESGGRCPKSFQINPALGLRGGVDPSRDERVIIYELLLHCRSSAGADESVYLLCGRCEFVIE